MGNRSTLNATSSNTDLGGAVCHSSQVSMLSPDALMQLTRTRWPKANNILKRWAIRHDILVVHL
jgi:hypothetical protein